MFMKSRLRNLKEFVMKKANVDSVQRQQREWGTNRAAAQQGD